MTVSAVLAAGLLIKFVAVLFFVCAVVLVLVILIQKGRGGGLSAAFGGGMVSGLLGTKTGDVLTWITIGLVGMFLILAVSLAKYYRPSFGEETEMAPVRQSQSDANLPQAADKKPLIPRETAEPVNEVNLPGV